MGRLRIVGIAALVIGLAGAGYWYWTRPQPLPESVLAAQRALATPDALALVQVDVSDLASLEPGDGTGLLAEARRQLATHPLAALDWEDDTTHLVAALYDGESLSTAAVLVGQFDPARLQAALAADPRFHVSEDRLGSERVWRVALDNPDSCEPGADWLIHAGPDHLAIATPERLESYLQRLKQGSAATGELASFEAFAPRRMLSALLLPAAAVSEHPVVAALRQEVESALAPLQGGVRIGLASTPIPGSSRLDIELALPGAEGLAERWMLGRDARQQTWSRIVPSLAALHAEIEVEGSGTELRAQARLPDEWLANAFRVTDELLVLASRSEAWSGDSAPVQALDPRPRKFRAEYPVSGLPRFDPQQPLAGPGDRVAGPFGLQVRAVRRGAAAGLEIEVEADGPLLANLGESSPVPRLVISSVRGKDGRELLATEACGPDRNGRPAGMLVDPSGDWMRARKTVRIDPAAGLDDVASLQGHVELPLAVRTEAETLAPEVGAVATRDGVKVEITGVSSGSFSYRVSGEGARALEVRGLGGFSRALPVSASWTQDLLFDAGRVGTRSLRGELEQIEVIFSVEEKSPRYAYRFDNVRPGTDREETSAQSVRFVEYSPEQYQKEFSPRFGVPFETNPPPRARTTAGPFTLALREERRADESTRRLHVLAPDIPNLSYNLTALELAWDEHTVPLQPRYRFGREELTCAVDLDALGPESSRMQGELVLRLAQDVGALRLDTLEPGRVVEDRGVRLEVTELGRDRFSARVDGDVTRLVAVAALNEDGEALVVEPLDATPSGAGVLRNFRVLGQPTKLEVQVAGSFERMAYPFELDWTAQVPAAPAP